MEYSSFQTFSYIWMTIAVLVFVLLLKVTAPYGRHSSPKWGPQVSNRLGWILMEFPVMAVLMYYVLKYPLNNPLVTYTLVAFFMLHYINRTFIFPFRIHTKGKKMPLLIVCSGICFNLVNGFSLGYFFSHFARYPADYFVHPPFIAGSMLFFTGIYINWKSDSMLIGLRKPGETGYTIPKGWLFNRVSCPNLFGEIIEWAGYAVLCWNLPSVSFFIWTVANLVPRALSHHAWYKSHFENYPEERKAVIPYLL